MYTAENYLWGMVTYYVGAALVLYFCWHFRRVIGWRPVRHLLLILVSVLLLLPFNAYPDLDYLAPAWFICLFEGLTGSAEQGYLRAGVPLMVACIAAIALYLIGLVVQFFRARKKVTEVVPSMATTPDPEQTPVSGS